MSTIAVFCVYVYAQFRYLYFVVAVIIGLLYIPGKAALALLIWLATLGLNAVIGRLGWSLFLRFVTEFCLLLAAMRVITFTSWHHQVWGAVGCTFLVALTAETLITAWLGGEEPLYKIFSHE